MNWKTSLDRYLTEPPDDGFDNWCDETISHLSDDFYKSNDDWVCENNGVFNKWAQKLFYKRDKTPKEAAAIIEKAHKLHINKNNVQCVA